MVDVYVCRQLLMNLAVSGKEQVPSLAWQTKPYPTCTSIVCADGARLKSTADCWEESGASPGAVWAAGFTRSPVIPRVIYEMSDVAAGTGCVRLHHSAFPCPSRRLGDKEAHQY